MAAPDRLLVTGANGFIGSAVARLAERSGRRIRVLVRASSSRANLDPGADVAIGDLRDARSLAAALRDVRHVVHVAADYRLWARDPREIFAANVEGARNLMEACLEAGVEKIVHTSSVATLAPDPTGAVDETHRLAPDAAPGAYEASKILSERLVEEMIARRGLPATIVQPATTIGPRDVRPTPTGRIILAAARGRIPAFVDTGLTIAHVDDVAAGHLAALERGRIGERYILGGETVALRQLLADVAAIAGRRPPRLRLPQPIAYAAACLAEMQARVTGREPLATRNGVRLSRRFMYFDDSKARAELGYAPRPYREALEDAVAWFRAEGYLT